MKYQLGIDCDPRSGTPDVYAQQLKDKFNLEGLDVANVSSKCFNSYIWYFDDERDDLMNPIHKELETLNKNKFIVGSVICDFYKKTDNIPKVDQRVIDFVNGLNQLCKATGIIITGKDWNNPVIQNPEGIGFDLDDTFTEDNIMEFTATMRMEELKED